MERPPLSGPEEATAAAYFSALLEAYVQANPNAVNDAPPGVEVRRELRLLRLCGDGVPCTLCRTVMARAARRTAAPARSAALQRARARQSGRAVWSV
jgi:hypothetical protein